MYKFKGNNIYGFAYATKLSDFDFDEINEKIGKRYDAPRLKIIISLCDDVGGSDTCVWLVASDKYLEEDMVIEVINDIVDEDLQYEYLLMNNP